MEDETQRDLILGNLCRALEILKTSKHVNKLIPEVRINFVHALENAKTPKDVAAIPGRITAIDEELFFPSYPQFGASDHMARAMIEIMKYDPSKRAGINFKYTDELRDWLENYCKKENLKMGLIDRAKEPKEVSIIDGRSMPWKIRNLIEGSNNKVPDIFYENEAIGKEALFVLIGTSAVDVAKKFTRLTAEYFKNLKGDENGR